jgi:hypothetical protein
MKTGFASGKYSRISMGNRRLLANAYLCMGALAEAVGKMAGEKEEKRESWEDG